MGTPLEKIYRSTLARWVNTNQPKNVVVIYDKSRETLYRYGAKITPQSLADNGVRTVKEVPFLSKEGPIFDREIKEVISHKPNAIVVVALPWDSANIVRQLAANIKVPIFVATPYGWSSQVTEFVSESNAQVFFGAQFWLDPKSDRSMSIMKRLRDRLGWSDAEVSGGAVQVYDAIQLVGAAVMQGGASWRSLDKPWDQIGEIEGASGQLTITAGNIVVSPMRLVEVTRDGLRAVEVK